MRYTCSKCGKRQPASKFPPNRLKANGLSSWCRTCSAETTRAWRARTNYNERYRDARRKVAKERRRKSLEELEASNARLRAQSRRAAQVPAAGTVVNATV
jgi:hypothetical protein